MRTDVNAFLGDYPWRPVPGGTPADMLAAMDRVGIDEAWVSYLPGVFWKDPMDGNARLFAATAGQARLRAVPAIHPGLPRWEETLADAMDRGVPAVRCDPCRYGLDPAGDALRGLVARLGQTGAPLLLAVRLEDVRQRHPNDVAPELQPAAVRSLLRADTQVRLIVTHADRDFIEQVHFGSTPDESARVLWDISWIWGPPEDHLALLLRTVGVERFTFGTGMPLRLPEAGVAKLDLLDLPAGERARVEGGNLVRFTE